MKTKNLILSVLTASLLTACGGGGGGSTPVTTSPDPVVTVPDTNTTDTNTTLPPVTTKYAPVANDQSITLNEDGTYSITLTATDADGDQITTYMINSGVTHGTITGTEPNITYIPDPNYNGSDSLSFWAYTNSDDANGGYSNTATVAINVLPINDAPTANDFNLSLDVNETNTTTQDWTILASADDVDGDDLTATIQTQGSNGTFTINGNEITYNKTSSSTTDSGVLAITDGTETITVAIQVDKLYWLKKGVGIGMKSNHTIWSWGSNSNGEFGDGTETDSTTPVQEITKATDWKDFSKGDYHVVALKNNGTVWCWGYGANGQLANGSTANENVPTQEITQATDWKAIGAGAKHTTALKTDGTIWSWGANYDNQLGIDGTGSGDPVQEESYGSDWDQIAVGSYHVLAIKTDGSLWDWGRENEMQLARGNQDQSNIDALIGRENTFANDWVFISAGTYNSVAIKSDGTMWFWGDVTNGDVQYNVIHQEASNATNWKSALAKKSGTNNGITALKNNGSLYGFFGSGFDWEKTPTQEKTYSTDWAYIIDTDTAIKTTGEEVTLTW